MTDPESPFQPDQLRAEERISGYPRHERDRWQPDGMSAPPDEPLPPAGDRDPRSYASLISRTVRNGIEVLMYQANTKED